MKLISLVANKASFHRVDFKDGINIVAGRQSNTNMVDQSNTYNGVGKSLIIHLLHFCLGSNTIKGFETGLPGWIFTLKFSIDGKEYAVSRSTGNQKRVVFCRKDISVPEFREKMLKMCFGITEPPQYMTWNTLFPRFARRNRASYINFDTFVSKEKDYTKLLNNGFLLGLDKALIVDKQELRKKQNDISNTEKSIKKDSFFKQYFLGTNDAELDSVELDYEIKKIQRDLDEFKVSNNYHELEKELSSLRFDKQQKENSRSLIEINIDNIKKSLEQEIEVSPERLFKIYNSVNLELPNMVKKDIESVLSFHNELLKNRNAQLQDELLKNEKKIEILKNQISSIGMEMDRLFHYLGSHGALEEYQAISDQVQVLKSKREKISSYQDILKTYQKAQLDIKTEYLEQEKKSNKYLEEEQVLIESLKSSFHSFAKEFYPKKTGGLIIKNNSGENQLRFTINAKIDDDSSDGVNEVKIFCFDILFLLSKISNIQFLIHDSRLFSNMDPRQRRMVFKLIDEISKEHNVQYICSLNEDTMQSIEGLMNPEEYNSLIEENIILELTDDSPESKLLGIQVDIDLEK